MFYEAELRLLRDTFKKSRIQTTLVDIKLPLIEQLDVGLHRFISGSWSTERPVQDILTPIKSATMYRLNDPLGCQYLYFLLPGLSREMLLVVGPYVTQPLTQQAILECAERCGLSPSLHKQLQSYFSNIPILPVTSHLFVLLDAFGERLWGINGFTVEDIAQDRFATPVLPTKSAPSDSKDALWNMKNMEQRYCYENELMHAVSKGQIHKADILLNSFSSFSFEQRLADPVRNAKNYCIIMNTLLRKAAEQGGVHPVYLDGASSDYAARIEQCDSLEAIPELMSEIFRGYCRLVRKHSMKAYSPPVQKVITCIDSDLSGNLNLRTLAQMLNVSNSYLSTLFKNEVGQTLTEYINQRRVNHAKHLLQTTHLQVQTIAQHCGIMDIHYFSKVFKKITGQTPKEYRSSMNR